MDEQLREKLGFSIEDSTELVRVLTWNSGGCRPAQDTEIALWDALAALSQPAAQGDSCHINQFSSRACEKGTKGCTVVHPAGGECGGGPQPLTDAEIIEIRKTFYGGRFGFPETAPWADSIKFARAILAAPKATA